MKSRRFHRERSDQVSGNKSLVLQQRQIARPVQAFHRSVLQTVNLPCLELSGQQYLFSSRHRLSSSPSTARVCNQVARDNLQKRNKIQPLRRLENSPRSVNWFMASLAAGSNFQIKQCGLTIRSTGPIAACRHLGYKSLAQMPARHNGPVSSNVRRHK